MKHRFKPRAKRSPWLALVHTCIQLRLSPGGSVTLRTMDRLGFEPVTRALSELSLCDQRYLAALGVLSLADEAFG